MKRGIVPRLWLIVGLALVGCAGLVRPPDPDRKLSVHVAGDLFESDRGYQFAALPEPGAQVIRVDVRYPVGAADDPPGKEGLAHLVEHLLFDKELRDGDKVTSIGAELGRFALGWNAETQDEHTDYITVAPPTALDDVIRLEVERIATGCGGLSDAIVAREREVVINELRQRRGATGLAFQRAIRELVYPEGHRGRALDTADSVAGLGLADVCGFIAAHYYRGKAYVVVSGDVTAAALQQAASHHFGRMPPRKAEERVAPPGLTPRPATARAKADVEVPYLIATWPLPAEGSRDRHILDVLLDTIAPALDHLASSFGAGRDAFSDVIGGAYAPSFVLGVELTSLDEVERARDGILDAARFSWRDTPSWEGAAERLLATWESLAGRNAMFADFLQFDRGGGYLIGQLAELNKVTPEEIREVAGRWLSPDHVRYLVLEPTGPRGAGHRTYAGGGEAEHGVVVDLALADKPLPAPPRPAPLETIRYELGNGLDVILWPHGSTPVVHGELLIHGGAAQEPAGAGGLATFMGAGSVEVDSLRFYDRELSLHVDRLIADLGVELRSPGYAVTDAAKKALKVRLRRKGAAERRGYAIAFATALYGKDHPYAHPPLTEDSLDAIHHDQVMDWARAQLVPKNATLILTGQFDPQLIEQHVAYNLVHLAGGGRATPIEVAPAPKAAFLPGYAPRPRPTVELDVGFVGGRGVDPNHARRLVLEEVLASRLAALRGAQAVTYGAQVGYTPRLAGGFWHITAEVDAHRAAEAGAAIGRTLAEMRRDPASYRAAFVLARRQVVARLLASATDAASVRDRLAFMAEFDLPDTYDATLAAAVAQLTLADFAPFVSHELAADHQVFGAYGDEVPVDDALAAAQAAAEE